MSKALPYLQISVYPEIKNYDIVMAFTRFCGFNFIIYLANFQYF